MGKLPKQTKRRALVKRFRELGFSGPYSGTGRHPEFMQRGDRTVKLPNAHRSDVGEGLLKIVLEEAGVTESEWLGEGDAEAGTAMPASNGRSNEA